MVMLCHFDILKKKNLDLYTSILDLYTSILCHFDILKKKNLDLYT